MYAHQLCKHVDGSEPMYILSYLLLLTSLNFSNPGV